jgi:hypothetical protein
MSDDSNRLRRLIAAHLEDDLEIVVPQAEATVHFTKTHLAELHAILEADAKAVPFDA